jgi:hypothetical protein
MISRALLYLFVLSFVGACPMSVRAQTPSAGEAEVQRCFERIATVHREMLNRYDAGLGELQQTFQKAADLEGALVVRSERQRAASEGTLTEKFVVAEPRALRTFQMQTLAKLQELVAQVVQESLPRLIEAKRALTITGKLDEAVAVRDAITKLQSNHVPLASPDPAVAVPVDSLAFAYSADRARADQTYRNQRITVRGVLSGYRPDPADPKQYLLYINGNSGAWMQCAFPVSDFTFREDKQFNATFLVVIPKGTESAVQRLQKGQSIEIRGTGDGFDEVARLVRCDSVR